jgi:hypothetical protein
MSDSTSLFHYQKEVSQLGKNGCTSYTVWWFQLGLLLILILVKRRSMRKNLTKVLRHDFPPSTSVKPCIAYSLPWMLVNIYQTTQCNIPEVNHLHTLMWVVLWDSGFNSQFSFKHTKGHLSLDAGYLH